MIAKDESITALFELKQKFLRLIPHPKLIKSAINKANRNLNNPVQITEIADVRIAESEVDGSLIHFLNQRIVRELELKKQISDAQSYERLADVLLELYINQVTLCYKLQAYLPVIRGDLDDNKIKMSDPFDLYEILKSIKGGAEDGEIKQKIKSDIENHFFENSIITNACLRANKIIVNG